MAILEVKDLEVYYGVIQAIKGISFEVNQGEIIALIGANGAGKTTTLQTITGLIPSKAGKIIYEGNDITRIASHKLVSLGIAHVPEGRRVFAQLTVLQNLKLGAYTRNIKDNLCSLSASGGEKESGSRNFKWWRTTDACYGQSIDVPSKTDCYG